MYESELRFITNDPQNAITDIPVTITLSGTPKFALEIVGSIEGLAGKWKLSPEEGSMQVGPDPYSNIWWQNSVDDVTIRDCFFDDEYIFNSDGSFQNVLGDETWLETWQGVDADQCGAPVAPHDGSSPAFGVTLKQLGN